MADIHGENILAYVEGRMLPAERRRFEQAMQESEQLRREVDDMQFVYGISGEMGRLQAFDTAEAWRGTRRRIRRTQRRHTAAAVFGRVAAVLFVPLLVAAAYFYIESDTLGRLAVGSVEQRCAYGLVSKITLPDSSVVWLNSGSAISYPRRFTGGGRKVKLDGEAYFKVSADSRRRFDVETPHGMTVSAHGTEFDVKAYADDDEARATLAKGVVDVAHASSAVAYTLSPGEQAVYSRRTGRMEVSAANVYMNTAWKDGRIVFRRTAMSEVARQLSRHFNVRIVLKDSELLGYTYSATFEGESFEDIMRLLEQTSPIRYTITNPEQTDGYKFSKRTVVIEKK